MPKLGQHARRHVGAPRRRIFDRGDPPTIRQLYAIARKEHEPGIDMGEWSERIKLRLVRDGHAYPAGEDIALAMKQIGKSAEPDVYRIQPKRRR